MKPSLPGFALIPVLVLFAILCPTVSAHLLHPQDGEQLIPFETIASSPTSGIREKQYLVITNRMDWKRIWKKAHKVFMPRPLMPEIDFKQNIVIGVFNGESGDGAHRISITKVSKIGNKLQIHIKETHGNSMCPPPPIASQSYHIIAVERIKKAKKNIEFLEPEHEIVRCR